MQIDALDLFQSIYISYALAALVCGVKGWAEARKCSSSHSFGHSKKGRTTYLQRENNIFRALNVNNTGKYLSFVILHWVKQMVVSVCFLILIWILKSQQNRQLARPVAGSSRSAKWRVFSFLDLQYYFLCGLFVWLFVWLVFVGCLVLVLIF